MLVLGLAGCEVYGPDLVADAAAGQAGTGAMGGGAGVMSTGGEGAMGAVGGSGGEADGGTAGSGGTAGTSPVDTTRAYVRGGTRVPPIIVDFTIEGFRDWAHWGLVDEQDYNHKQGVPSQLLDFKPMGAATHTFKEGSPMTFKWSDGTPIASASTPNGIAWRGLNEGFELIAPAVDEERRVNLYIGITAGSAEIKASLSDPQAPSQVEDHVSAAIGAWNMRHLQIEYGFAAEGSELDVTVKVSEALNGTSAVALHGVTFEGP